MAADTEITVEKKKIEESIDRILHIKNERIHELEMKLKEFSEEKERLLSHNNTLFIQNRQLEQHIRERQSEYNWLQENSAKLIETNSLIARIRELEQCISNKQSEFKKLEEKLIELMNPTQEMRRRGYTIRPGDITHEDVAKRFKEIFSDRNILKPIGISKVEWRSHFLTKIFESAYDVSKDHVIEKVVAEVTKLFTAPTCIYTIDERRESEVYIPWNSRKEALSLLLSLEKIKEIPVCLIDKIEKKLVEKEIFRSKQVTGKITDIRNVTASVAELTWSMVTLSPPVTLSGSLELFPLSDEHWELTNTENAEIGNCTNICRRPILFFGPLGTVGVKGNAALQPKKEQDKSGSHSVSTCCTNRGTKESTEKVSADSRFSHQPRHTHYSREPRESRSTYTQSRGKEKKEWESKSHADYKPPNESLRSYHRNSTTKHQQNKRT